VLHQGNGGKTAIADDPNLSLRIPAPHQTDQLPRPSHAGAMPFA